MLGVWIVVCWVTQQCELLNVSRLIDSLAFKGLYANLEQGIKGAPGAMIIHCDKNQNQEQIAQERDRQRRGEEPMPLLTRQRFQDGISLPEVTVISNTAGSSTQETFFHFCQHFVASVQPPNKREPIILFLDGHASRWNTQALRLLMRNRIFPFFLPSHTSIWSQPNDAGINIGFHAAIENATKKRRRGAAVSSRTPTVCYHNEILSDALTSFNLREREDILEPTLKRNNTTNAWERTGLFPFNPLCEAWTTAIATLGNISEKQKESQQAAINYEVRTKPDLADALTIEEKNILRENLDLGSPDNDMGDLYVARIRATSMLARWRDDIEKAVEEGNNREEYSRILKPKAKTEAEKVAIKLIDFFEPPHAAFDLSQEENNKQMNICQDTTVQILNGTAIGDGINLTYYSSSSSDSEEDDSVKGTATKSRKTKVDQTNEADVPPNNDDDISWFVVLANGQKFEVVENDLKNAEQYKVHLPTNNQFLPCVAENKKRKQQRQWRQRKLQAEKEERFVVEEAQKEMTSFWKDQWQKLVVICETPDRSLGWEECATIFKKIAEPYKTKINGRDVTVNASDSAVLMRDLSLSRFADTILKQDEESDEQEDGQFAQSTRPKKKQKNTNNSAIVNTTFGADGYTALSQTQRRDIEYINKKDADSSKKTNERKKWIDATLTLVTNHKERCEKDKQLQTNRTSGNNPNCLEYFQFDAERTSKNSRLAILRLLAPDAKVLSKSKDIQCQLILQQIVPSLCKELFDNKESCLRMELASLNPVSGNEQHGETDDTMMETTENNI